MHILKSSHYHIILSHPDKAMKLKSFLVSCFNPTIIHPSYKAPAIPTFLPIYL